MSNKSSVIDYTSETSYSDSNLINSDIDTQNMYKKLSKHKVVGTRYDSSTESIGINTETLAFGIPNPLFAVTLPTTTPYSEQLRL
jgi:hypothetical protein